MNTFVIKKYTTPGFSKVYQVAGQARPARPDPGQPRRDGRFRRRAGRRPRDARPRRAARSTFPFPSPFPSPSPSPGSRPSTSMGLNPSSAPGAAPHSAPRRRAAPCASRRRPARPPAGTTPPRTARRRARRFLVEAVGGASFARAANAFGANALAPCGALWRRASFFSYQAWNIPRRNETVCDVAARPRAQVRGEQRLRRRRRGRQARQALGRERPGRAPPRRRARPCAAACARGAMAPSTAARHARVAAEERPRERREERRQPRAPPPPRRRRARRRRRRRRRARRMAARPTRVPREGLWNMFSVSAIDTENRKSTSAPIGRGTSGGKDAVGRRHSGFPKTEARTVPATVRKKSRPRSR